MAINKTETQNDLNVQTLADTARRSGPALTPKMRATLQNASLIWSQTGQGRRGRPSNRPLNLLGLYLYAWCIVEGISMSRLASIAGLCNSTLSTLVRDWHEPSYNTLRKLAAVTGDSVFDYIRLCEGTA